MKESILDAMHETAKDLTEAGVMDMQTMRQVRRIMLARS